MDGQGRGRGRGWGRGRSGGGIESLTPLYQNSKPDPEEAAGGLGVAVSGLAEPQD